ncbi:nucleotidyl transferase AbiEii/AbiGii toxin family protein [Pedobacter sp. BS3]|uniref:nucleotidyl transferase AbiEii/AbiGii toxin family protein n=1 Tax=Pedobacter sp. BS3 TaxID=2567937 RepID=UPI0016597FC3|nr:nucleotidyl transferase AbiEii/AbiGii toxin family protein [Pedobacter sp. BS3]
MPELSNFRLVGGTALSLLLGHRKSIDIDLFTDIPFEKDELINLLDSNFPEYSSLENRSRSIFQCIIKNVKVDFVCVKDPFIHPVDYINTIPFANIKDIIALKLNTIKGRGAKKDFWDVAKLLQLYELGELLNFYQARYPYDDTFAVMRSIVYFDDAEDDADPEIIEKISWEQVKNIIKKAFNDYYKQNTKN